MSMDFYEAVRSRRTYYAIGKQSPVSDERIKEVVDRAALHTPTAFNSQSGRLVLLLGEHSDKLWDIVLEELRKIVPADAFAQTQQRIAGFRAGYGTVLFFEDQAVVEGLQKEFALYKDNFPVWSLEAAGMLQFVMWTSLEQEGFGASLQHYNPLINEQVRRQWGIPAGWKLLAQMPFGKPTAGPGEKEFLPLEDRVKLFQ